jgi:predicted RNA-binding protein with PUA-like domain
MGNNSWLAPIKVNSWKIIYHNNVYGVPLGKKYELDQTEEGDYIAFYIYPPICGIVGIGKIISKPYIDQSTLWSDNNSKEDKYSYRIRLNFDVNYILNKKNPIPLYEVLGFNNLDKGYTIEPYLHNVVLIKLSQRESHHIIKKIKEKITSQDQNYSSYF